jgi:hypothetical protein
MGRNVEGAPGWPRPGWRVLRAAGFQTLAFGLAICYAARSDRADGPDPAVGLLVALVGLLVYASARVLARRPSGGDAVGPGQLVRHDRPEGDRPDDAPGPLVGGRRGR